MHGQEIFAKPRVTVMKISLLFRKDDNILEHLLQKVIQADQVKLQPMMP